MAKKNNGNSVFLISAIIFLSIIVLGIWKAKDFENQEHPKALKQIEQQKTISTNTQPEASIQQRANTEKDHDPEDKTKRKEKTTHNGFAIITTGKLEGHNTVSYYNAQKSTQYQTDITPKKKNTKNQIRDFRKNIPWQWQTKSGSNAKMDKGIFHLTMRGDLIDESMICNNYKSGSLIYRSCRKAAKQWLKNECRKTSRDIICKAANMQP